MSVQRCMHEHSSDDFLGWQEYFRLELNRPSRADYYAAQIALHVCQAFGGAKNATIADFILAFENKNENLTQKEKEQKAANSKAVWLSTLGLKEEE